MSRSFSSYRGPQDEDRVSFQESNTAGVSNQERHADVLMSQSRSPHKKIYSRTTQQATDASGERPSPARTPASSREDSVERPASSSSFTPKEKSDELGTPEDLNSDPIQSPPFAMFSRADPRCIHRDAFASKRSTLPRHNSPSNQRAPSQDARTNDTAIRKILVQQEARIKDLEAENRALRDQVNLLISATGVGGLENEGLHAARSSNFEGSNSRREGSFVHQDPYKCMSASTAPASPGQKFVAELCELIELDTGHHALLSSIMDRDRNRSYGSDFDYHWHSKT